VTKLLAQHEMPAPEFPPIDDFALYLAYRPQA
jgi:hypothetical protein